MDHYSRNMSALRQRNRLLAQILEQKLDAPARLPAPAVEVLTARDGFPILSVGGRVLQSRYDPRKEAADLIAAQKLENVSNIFLFGFGLGYHAGEILRSGVPFALMMIVEPDPAVLKAALCARDLTDILRDPRVLLCPDATPQEVFAMLAENPLAMASGRSAIIELPNAVRLHPEYYAQLWQKVSDAIRTGVANVHTSQVSGSRMLHNAVANLLRYAVSPGINTLAGSFAGVPAILVAAGPSLDKNIDQLHAAKGKALILATDTAFKILDAHGIVPDMVFTIDYKPESERHFQGMNTAAVPVAFDLEAAPEGLALCGGASFAIATTRPINGWITGVVGDKGTLSTGMSVAHTVFSAAAYMGCDPIVFIGQDLSYPGGVTHARGTGSREQVADMLNRPGEKMMKVVSDLTGEELMTRRDMYVYLRHFERLVSQAPCRCINATEGGAGIKGTSVMTLSDAIDEYCRQPVDAAGVLAAAAAAYVPPSAAAVRGGIDDLLRQIRPVIDAAEEVINLLTRILALFENGPADREQVRALLASTREPARIVREAEALLRIIHTELVRELLQMRREGRVEAETFAARDDAALAADFRDDLNFQRAVARGLRNLAGWLANVRERLEDGNSASSR